MRLGLGLAQGLPALLHPGRGEAWWWGPWGAVWSDGERLWVTREGAVEVLDLAGVVEVSTGRDLVFARGDGGRWARIDGDRVQTGLAATAGADVCLHRAAGRWEGAPFPLPDGAHDSRALRAFPTGRGVVWASGGVLYRHDGRIHAVATLRDRRWTLGPQGAVLLGDGARWTHHGVPGRTPSPLPVPLPDTDWGVRWSADGCRVVGPSDALPLDAEGTVLEPGTGTVRRGEQVLLRGVREASWAVSNERLAGPGGVVWDLRTGRRAFEQPVLRLGACAPHPDGWLTVDWETHEALVVDEGGRTVRTAVLPLGEDDVVEAAWREGDAFYVRTVLGRTWEVGGEPREVPEREPREPEIEDPPDDLPLDAALTVAGRRWGWSTDGLLVAYNGA